MKPTKRDYTEITKHAASMGFWPERDQRGEIVEGFYYHYGVGCLVDLTACADDEMSVVRTIGRTLCQKAREANAKL